MVPRLPTGRPLGLRAYKVRLCVRERPWWASSGPRPSLSSLGPTAAFAVRKGHTPQTPDAASPATIGASDLLGLMDVVDTKMKVRCFLMIVLNRLLIPSSGFHLNDRQAQIAWDLGSVEKIDWCKLVFEDLKDCIKNRRNDTDNCSGCSIVLLVSSFNSSFV